MCFSWISRKDLVQNFHHRKEILNFRPSHFPSNPRPVPTKKYISVLNFRQLNREKKRIQAFLYMADQD
jgi:hypothetical protein